MTAATTAPLTAAGTGGWAIALALAAGLGVGAITLSLPAPAVLAAPLIALGLWIFARWPEYGLLTILAYTSTVLSEDLLPPLSIGVGSLHLSDLLVLYLFVVLGVQLLVSRNLRLLHTPADLPILLFLAICIGSTLFGISDGRTPFDDGIRGLRHAGYLTLFFLITQLIETDGQMRRLWAGVMLLALATAIASLLQTLFGTDLAFLPGRVESLKTQGNLLEGIARIIPPGESLLYVSMILGTLALIQPRSVSPLRLIGLGLIAVALVLTYRRMLWGSILFALLAALALVPWAAKLRLLRGFIMAIAVASIAIVGTFVTAPDSKIARSLAATGERLGSIVDPDLYRRGDPDLQTLEQRALENSYVLQQLQPPSLFGIGLGASYRPCLNLDADDCLNPNYLHNTYLGVILRLGMVGMLAFCWLLIVSLWVGFKAQSRGFTNRYGYPPWRDQLRLGCALAFAGLLPAMLLEPYIFIWNWSPVIALLLAGIFWRARPAQQALSMRIGSLASPWSRPQRAAKPLRLASDGLAKRFLAGVLATGLGSLSVVMLGMLALMVTARVLPAEALGAFFLLQTLVVFFSEGSAFGIHIALERSLSGVDDPHEQQRVISTAFLFRAVTIAITALALLLWAAPLVGLFEVSLTPDLVRLLVGWLVLEALFKLTMSHHQARFAFNAIGVANLLSSLTNLILVLVLVLGWQQGLAALLVAKLGSRAVALGYAWLACLPRLRFRVDPMLLRQMLGYSLPLYGNYFLAFLSQRADTLLIGSMLGPSAVAVYEVARRIPESLTQFHDAFRQVYFPFIARHAQQHNQRHVADLVNNSTRFGALLLGLSCVISFAFGPEIIELLFSASYAESALPFALLMAAYSLLMIESTLGTTLAAVGDSMKPLLINSVRTSLLLIAYLSLIPKLGLVGAAAASLAAAAAVIPVNLYFLRRSGLAVDGLAFAKPVLITAAIALAIILAATAPTAVRVALVLSYLPAVLLVASLTPAEIAAAIHWLRRALTRGARDRAASTGDSQMMGAADRVEAPVQPDAAEAAAASEGLMAHKAPSTVFAPPPIQSRSRTP